MKQSLTRDEKMTCAYMHYVHNVEQQVLAILYMVNIGRVNEACIAILEAIEPKKAKDDNPL